MICEVLVLFRVQHLQQSRRRVSLVVSADLVDLVKEEDRILRAALLDGVDDPARDRTDVCSSVSSDLCFVTDAAQGHSHKLSSDGSRH